MHIEFLADKPDAVSIIAQWYFQQWGHKDPGNSVQATVERLKQKLNKDILPIPLIAVEDETVIGTAQLKRHEMDIFPEREFWLGGVFVSSEFRGRGVARVLIEKVLSLATTRSIQEVWLQTERLDGGLYADMGWVGVEQLCYHGEEVLVMVNKTWESKQDLSRRS